MTQQVVVLGAGMVGRAVAADMAREGFRVAVAETRRESLARLAGEHHITALQADLSRPEAVREVVAGADLVLGALPSQFGMQTLQAVIDAGKAYVDISFMPENAWDLDPLARERGVCAVVDCGVAPGVSNLLCGLGAGMLDDCQRLEIYVGGLPVERRSPFQYKAGFAPSDVLEEYTRPARIVEKGRIVVKEALSEPEMIDFPGVGTLEAFNTDGLRSLAYHLKVPEMKEKTLRYPGHIELMRVLRHIGYFSKEPLAVEGGTVRPLDLTAQLLFPKWMFEEGEADLTVMRVLVEGIKGGKRIRHTWDLLDRYDPVSKFRSMSRTTGFAATSMAAVLLRGAFKKPGVHPPELLAREPGLVETFLAEYARRGVKVSHRADELPRD
jgi:saccharopine dehydrogenase-like NADP-dependent oxidoreductase